MIKVLKTNSLLLYFIISLFFYETLLKLSISQPPFSGSLFSLLMFSLSSSILFFIISILFSGEDGFFLAFTLLLLLSFIYASQVIYYKFFKTFYTVYSAFYGGQVFEFWQDILIILKKYCYWLVLFFLPPMLIFILKNRILYYPKLTFRLFLLLLLLLVFTHGLAVASLYIGDKKTNSL